MNPKLFSVFSTDTGIRFNVRILDKGDKYGLDNCLTYDESDRYFNADDPQVEFYDHRYPHTEYGQFTGGRYYMSTLLERNYSVGLCLHGGVEDWGICVQGMNQVRLFLKEYMKQRVSA